MIELLPESEGAVMGVKITGKVNLEMEKEWIAKTEAAIKEHGRLKFLLQMGEKAGWDLDAGLEDFKWLIKHADDLSKIALVADGKFWEIYVKLDQPFAKMYKIEEKFFKTEDIDSAWKWLKE